MVTVYLLYFKLLLQQRLWLSTRLWYSRICADKGR